MIFRHSGAIGDIVYSLPTVYSLSDRYAKGPASIYLDVGKDLSIEAAKALIPLLASQPGIAEVKVREDEFFDVDLDLFRGVGDLRIGHLPAHYFQTFAADYDLSQPWLWVTGNAPALGLVVSRSPRYRNPNISYAFMRHLAPVFLGLESEWVEFKKEVPGASWQPTGTLWQAAAWMSKCKVFAGNQSGLFSLAEGLKTPRVLEVCPYAPNVQPQGANARAATGQMQFERNVRDLLSS